MSNKIVLEKNKSQIELKAFPEKPPRKMSNQTNFSNDTGEEIAQAVADQDLERTRRILIGLNPQRKSWILNNLIINNKPILNYAAARGDVKMFQLLLDHGINPYLIRVGGMTCDNLGPSGSALHEAIRCGNHEIVQALLVRNVAEADKNSDIKYTLANLKDSAGLTPLLALADTPSLSDEQFVLMMKILCENGSDPTEKHPKTGQTVLFAAVERKLLSACRTLLDFGITLDDADCLGNTALHVAAMLDMPDILRLLLSYNRNPMLVNTFNQDGETPLHAAANAGSSECVRALLDHGADLSSHSPNSHSALDAIFSNIPRPTNFLLNTLNSKINPNECGINDRRFRLEIDFTILTPTNSRQMAVVVAIMKSLRNPDRRRVLSHPLIETFLRAKWMRLRVFFFGLSILHMLFVSSLSAHVICTVANHEYVVWSQRILLIASNLLLLHVAGQVYLSPKYFLRQCETWLSITCVSLSFIVSITGEIRTFSKLNNFTTEAQNMVFPDNSENFNKSDYFDQEEGWTRHIAAFAVLLAWAQLMFVIGRFPTFGVFALMFFTVFKNVLKVMIIWYCLVIGFALSFYIQHNSILKEGMLSAIIRTTVMLMGEYQYDKLFPPADLTPRDIPRWQAKPDNLGVTSQIIFLFFIFFGSIVLVNLMIGLAVSDIQGLRDEGNLRHMIKQAEFLFHVDYVLSQLKCFKNRKTVPLKLVISPNKGRKTTQRQFRELWLNIPSKLMEALVRIALNNAHSYERSSSASNKNEFSEIVCRNCGTVNLPPPQ